MLLKKVFLVFFCCAFFNQIVCQKNYHSKFCKIKIISFFVGRKIFFNKIFIFFVPFLTTTTQKKMHPVLTFVCAFVSISCFVASMFGISFGIRFIDCFDTSIFSDPWPTWLLSFNLSLYIALTFSAILLESIPIFASPIQVFPNSYSSLNDDIANSDDDELGTVEDDYLLSWQCGIPLLDCFESISINESFNFSHRLSKIRRDACFLFLFSLWPLFCAVLIIAASYGHLNHICPKGHPQFLPLVCFVPFVFSLLVTPCIRFFANRSVSQYRTSYTLTLFEMQEI